MGLTIGFGAVKRHKPVAELCEACAAPHFVFLPKLIRWVMKADANSDVEKFPKTRMNAYERVCVRIQKHETREAFFIGTADELMMAQIYSMKTAVAVFIRIADEPTSSQAYVMKMPRGIFIGILLLLKV